MGKRLIDLRSDTVTKPSAGMRRAMEGAEVGDDVFGEDPTVNLLQQRVAGMLGKEEALFVPSGSMGNQICIKVWTRPGDEVIVEKDSHVFNYETGGMAFLSSVQANVVEGVRGRFGVDSMRPLMRPSVYYMPRTRLVCVENTHNRAGGTVFPLESILEIEPFAEANGLRMHLDGARLWNASIASGVSPEGYASRFDSVSVCFSKGLGAPIGSAIAGSREFIEEARHYRKIFGGGMRQAGILAAAAIYALDHNMERLADDHRNAKTLASELSSVPRLSIDMEGVQTNIVLIDIAQTGKGVAECLQRLRTEGVLLTPGTYTSIRAVTHLDVTTDDVLEASRRIREVFT